MTNQDRSSSEPLWRPTFGARHRGRAHSGCQNWGNLPFRYFASLSLLIAATQAQADDFRFDQVTVELPGVRHEAVHPTALAGLDGRQLMVVSRTEEERDSPRVFRFLEVQEDDLAGAEPVLTVQAPPGALFYELAEVESQSLIRRQVLVVLTAERILQLEPGTGRWSTLAEIPVLFRAERNPDFGRLEMADDLDGDGHQELIVPTFEGYHVLSPAGSGHGLREWPIRAPVRMDLEGSHPMFQRFQPWAVDMDTDGRKDLVFLRDHAFHIHTWTDDGDLAREPSVIAAPMELDDSVAGDYMDIDREADQSDLTIHQLYRFLDVDGDGLADIVTRRTRSRGVLDKSTDLTVHLGRSRGQGLHFDREPDLRYSADGIQIGATLEDLDADGRRELIVPVLELGFMKILGALMSKSVDYDLNIYRLGPEHTDRPAFSRGVKVSFDLSTGFSRFPAVIRADFDGDGLLDQLVQTGDHELDILPGSGDGNLFRSRGQTFRVPLPSDGNNVRAMDLDADGDADLVLRYGSGDSAENQGLIRVLFSMGKD